MTKPPDTDSPLAAAMRLRPLVRQYAEQSEAERRLARPVVEALAGAGLFNLIVPEEVGGSDVQPLELLRVIEAVSAADGSAGWCLMVGAQANGMLGGWLAEPVARKVLFGAPGVVASSSITSGGKAVAVEGGYRVSGRWRFASGCDHCSWLFGDCAVWDGEEQRKDAQNKPLERMLVMPRGDCTVIDVWDVLGLRGTGSNDFAVEDVFVPEERSFDLYGAPEQAARAFTIPLGGIFAPANAAVGLGIARGAIDEALALAAAKKPFLARGLMRDDPRVQLQVAEAEGRLGAARAYLFETVGGAAAAVDRVEAVSQRETALIHLAAVHAARRAAEAVEIVYELAGTSAIVKGSPLERAFRDAHVVTQHLSLTARLQEDAGRVLLGLEPREPFF